MKSNKLALFFLSAHLVSVSLFASDQSLCKALDYKLQTTAIAPDGTKLLVCANSGYYGPKMAFVKYPSTFNTEELGIDTPGLTTFVAEEYRFFKTLGFAVKPGVEIPEAQEIIGFKLTELPEVIIQIDLFYYGIDGKPISMQLVWSPI
jgi:hypothetical protein